jgi:hypothetical protein
MAEQQQWNLGSFAQFWLLEIEAVVMEIAPGKFYRLDETMFQ